MITVKIPKEDIIIVKKESAYNSSSIVRKRCHVLLAKHVETKWSCERIAAATGCCRNFVMKTIHTYNNKGLDSVLEIAPKPGRKGKLTEHMDLIDAEFEKSELKSAAEAMNIIEEKCGIKVSLSRTRQILHYLGYRYRKMQPIPGKADPDVQAEWLKALQPVINQAKEGKCKLYFMDAVHFVLENFSCNTWCKKPKFLRGGAGRNRFNVLGAIDPFSLDLIETHSMTYVDAEQTILFLEKIRRASGDLPVSIVLDNARYQHCQAVMDKAKELNIELLFLPPYSPNLNIIERLWKYTRRHVLAGKYFPTPAEFHDALRYFFEVDFHNHKSRLKTLLTLKFQSFKNAHLICA